MVRCTREANYFRDYKRLGPFAKLATSYVEETDILVALAPFVAESPGQNESNAAG